MWVQILLGTTQLFCLLSFKAVIPASFGLIWVCRHNPSKSCSVFCCSDRKRPRQSSCKISNMLSQICHYKDTVLVNLNKPPHSVFLFIYIICISPNRAKVSVVWRPFKALQPDAIRAFSSSELSQSHQDLHSFLKVTLHAWWNFCLSSVGGLINETDHSVAAVFKDCVFLRRRGLTSPRTALTFTTFQGYWSFLAETSLRPPDNSGTLSRSLFPFPLTKVV